MTVLRKVAILLLVTAPAAFGQNGTQGLRQYLRQYKYTLFVPPRQNAAVDTVVNYSRGFETIVTSKCIPADKVVPVPLSPVVLTDTTETVSRSEGLEGSFAKAIDPKLSLSGAFSDARVQKIELSFVDAKETHVETKDLKDYIAGMDKSNSCYAILTNKKNLILGSLLQVTGIKYTFYDKDGKKVNLDTTLMKAIKLSGTYQKDYEGTDTLDVKNPVYVGYRAWKVREIPGDVKSRLQVAECDPAEIEALKPSHTATNEPTK